MRVLLAILAAILMWSPAHAQSFPSRQITIVVPFGAGGSADLLARILAAHMQTSLGQPVVVENRAGAGGSIGTNDVAKAPPDGYTLLLATTGRNGHQPAPSTAACLSTHFAGDRCRSPRSVLLPLSSSSSTLRCRRSP